LLLLLIVATLQTSALPSFSLAGIVPNLMLLVVVSWSVLRGFRAALLLALGGGLLLDLLSGGPFGAATASLVLSSVVMGLEQLNLFRDSLWLPLLGGVLATVLYNGAYLIMLTVFGRTVQWLPTVQRVILPEMALNVVVMYPVFWGMRWLHRRQLVTA
jgi:rod shape-determining protein MreD